MTIRFSMQGIRFEWNARKAKMNRRKHGVGFKRACEAFFDPFLMPTRRDRADGELREAILGFTSKWQLLHVAFVERDEVIRIISARRASHTERRVYEDQ